MRNTYGSLFKCRLCGKEHIENETEDLAVIYNSLINIVSEENGKILFGVSPSEHYMHHCADGSIGFSDFIGWKKYDGEVM